MTLTVGIPRESLHAETRVTATPESVKRLLAKGFGVAVERNAGKLAHFHDADYAAAGARIVDPSAALGADVVFKIHKPTVAEIGQMKSGALLLSHLDMCLDDGTWDRLAAAGVDALALELIPRISRAQAMDVLSSQSNIAGYRAVLEATNLYSRFFPTMMTAAGTAKPARVVVLGAGVAGLQAIATARRLGAQVWGYDVRPEVREQIASLGAKFIELDIGEDGAGEGGYAKALSADAQAREQAALTAELLKADIIISTAQIPCRPAPELITEDAVRGMRPGSVIIDMAAASGGNCKLTEADAIVTRHGVILCGITNLPAQVPTDASRFLARNLINLLELLIDPETGRPDAAGRLDDDIVAVALVTVGGQRRYAG